MRSFNFHHSKEKGFILPIVIIVDLIIGAGLMALSARTFAGLKQAAFQQILTKP